MNHSKKDPSISFAIATYNSQRTIEACLKSIVSQNYIASVEIVIADGGSTDNTLKIAKKYHARIKKVDPKKQNAEFNKGVAVRSASGELIVLIDHDNILPNKNWLKNMVEPFMQNPEIFGSAVWRFHYDRSLNLLDRYFALLGGTDPVPVFFNKSAHQGYLYDNYHLKGKLIKNKKDYFLVKLKSSQMPTLGGNGAVIRKKVLKDANIQADFFYHIDIHADLVKKGYYNYAFVKETITHLTFSELFPFLKRRMYYIEKYYYQDKQKRRYTVYESGTDKIMLLRYILYSITIFGPIIFSVRGYLKIKDLAWFLHPVMCLAMIFVYGYPTIKIKLLSR